MLSESKNNAEQFILQFIRSNALKPGDKLPAERELSKACGLSRATVRSAILQLNAKGLLQTKPGSGTYVTNDQSLGIIPGDTIDKPSLFEFRRLLEIESAFLAANRANIDDLSDLRSLNRQIEMENNEPKRRELITSFHKGIVSASKNRYIEYCNYSSINVAAKCHELRIS